MLNDKVLSDDIVQNVFIKLYENIDQIRNKKFIPAWIYKTARNEVYHYLRSKKRKQEEEIDEDFYLGDDSLFAEEYEFSEKVFIPSRRRISPAGGQDFSYYFICWFGDLFEALFLYEMYSATSHLS